MKELTIKERLANMSTNDADLCAGFYDKVINCAKPIMVINDSDFQKLLEGDGNIAMLHASDTSGADDRMEHMIDSLTEQYRNLGCTVDKAICFLFRPEDNPLTLGEMGGYIFFCDSIANKDTTIMFGSGDIPGNATHIGILVKYRKL